MKMTTNNIKNFLKNKLNSAINQYQKIIKPNTKLNYKKFGIPLFSIIGTYIYFKENKNNLSKLQCKEVPDNHKETNFNKSKIKGNKYLILNEPKIIIIYDDENELQKEMVEIILNKLNRDYLPAIKAENDKKIKVEKISIGSDEKIMDKLNLQNKNITYLKNKNEPLILIKNDYLSELINPYAFTKKNDDLESLNINHKLFTKLNNLLCYRLVTSMKELREEFRYLENPKHKLILLPSQLINDGKDNEIKKSLSLFRNKNTKFIIVNDADLQEVLSLKNDYIYQYYPSKLPYKMKDTDSFLQEFFDNKKKKENFDLNQNKQYPVNEILSREGIDLNSYLNSNSTSLMLKFNMFRDEIKISSDLIKKLDFGNGSGINKNGNFIEDRIKLQKLISFPIRNVTQIAETDMKVIESQFNQPDKYLLFIYVPNWSFLKENIFNAILFESPHLFDKIQIVNSKKFTLKHELYDETQISEEIPQIYMIETDKDPSKRKVYSMNYFRFADDFTKYLRNKKEVFNKPELIENLTYVTTLNSQNFEEKIIKDSSFKEFMLEVKHEGCPTCYMLGKMFDHMSQKFRKHKYDKKLKFFRVDTHNDLPYLGEFAATPTYLFCRKNDKGEIELISQVDKQDFLFKIKKLSKYDFTKVRYHPNIGFGFYLFQRSEFLKDTYDPDIDISGFNAGI